MLTLFSIPSSSLFLVQIFSSPLTLLLVVLAVTSPLFLLHWWLCQRQTYTPHNFSWCSSVKVQVHPQLIVLLLTVSAPKEYEPKDTFQMHWGILTCWERYNQGLQGGWAGIGQQLSFGSCYWWKARLFYQRTKDLWILWKYWAHGSIPCRKFISCELGHRCASWVNGCSNRRA